MRKSVFIIAAAVMAAVCSCSQRENVLLSGQPADNAVGFNVFTHSVQTKGRIIANDSIYGTTDNGIGIFAFYQPAAGDTRVNFSTKKFAAPNYMYNQKVTPVSAGYSDHWTYSPTKYWPNNGNDQLSFFAYAPYDENKTWDDLGFTTNTAASKITASIPIYDEKSSMKDILWADPLLNQTKGYANQSLKFEFRHVLAKVSLQIGIETNAAKGKAGAWNEANTDITINSIEFKGLAESYDYSRTIADNPETSWTCSGSMDMELTESDFQNNTIQATDRAATPTNVWNEAYWSSITDPTYYKDLLAAEDNSAAYLFLAPQTFEDGVKNLIITYTITTKEDWSSASSGSNDSKITNTIECELEDILPLISSSQTSHGLESGKAYNLKLLIGTSSVKVSAEVSEWSSTTDISADIPKNEVMPVTYTIYIDRPANIIDGSIVVELPTGWTKTTEGQRITLTGGETDGKIFIVANPSEDNVCHEWYRDETRIVQSASYRFAPTELDNGAVYTPSYSKYTN